MEIESRGARLCGHLSRPPEARDTGHGLVLAHGFPADPGGAATTGQTYPEFADRLAKELGWRVLSFNFRGAGASPGDFSLGGWLADLRAAIGHLASTEAVDELWVAGFSAGGALAICAAAVDERVRGVAALAAPADFSSWATDPARFLERAREVGVVRDPAFPPDVEAWGQELKDIRPVAVIDAVPPRPVLLVHGSDDELVPVDDARVLADAAHDQVDLRVLNGGGHRLRHDPRAVAMLIGWLEARGEET